MIERAVRTGTFMSRRGTKKRFSLATMMTSRKRMTSISYNNNNNNHCGGDHHLHHNPPPNMIRLVVVSCMLAVSLLCSLPVHSAAFVATPWNSHIVVDGDHPFFDQKSCCYLGTDESRQPGWKRSTTLSRAAATNDDDDDDDEDDSIIVSISTTLTSRRRRSQRTAVAIRASSAIRDSADLTTAGDPKRRRTSTSPKITRQATIKMQKDAEEEDEVAIQSKVVVVPAYRRRQGSISSNNNNNNNNPLKKKRKKSSSSSSSSELSFYDALMKDHAILTNVQELKLGRAVQRAKPLRLALERLMQEKRIEQQERLQLLKEDDDDDDDVDLDIDDDFDYESYSEEEEEEDRDHCDISNFSFAWQRREELEKASWLASCWQEGDDDEDEEENMPNADTLLLETLMAPPPPPPPPPLCNNNNNNSIGGPIYITDDDVIRYMNLPGGRAELQSILWNGIVARDTLIRSNIRLVVSIAKKWALQQAGVGVAAAGRGGGGGASAASYYNTQYLRAVYAGGWDRPSLDEAVQEGIVGLAEAVQRYDPSRNLRFATYATFWITNSVRKCFQSASTTCLRVPASYHDIKSRFNTLVRDHYQMAGVDANTNLVAAAARGQAPSLDVLAKELGITKDRLQRVLRATKPLLSLDQPRYSGMVKSDGGDNQMDLVLADSLSTDEYDNGGGRTGGSLPTSMEQGVELSFLRRSLENALATELAPYERDIVRLRLGLDDGVSRTAKQVVAAYGGDLSELDVRLAEKRAFSKLRSPHALSTYKFLAYLDFAGIDKETATLR